MRHLALNGLNIDLLIRSESNIDSKIVILMGTISWTELINGNLLIPCKLMGQLVSKQSVRNCIDRVGWGTKIA